MTTPLTSGSAMPPSGTVTFLFTDIEGSTKLAQKYPVQWEILRARHHALLHQAMDAHNGFVFQIIGDAFCVAFHTAIDALNAAVLAQRLFLQEPWSPAPIKVRMGINTGTAQTSGDDPRSGGYTGYTSLVRVQRVESVAYGGQILLSNTSAELVRIELPQDIRLLDLKEHRLKGLLNPERLWQVAAPDLPQDFPPLLSLNAIPNNLPLQLTSFVGREKEQQELKELLEKTRLLSLTGSGGAGKTRLSLQIAADLIDEFPDGVWFVELAPLTDATLIPQTIASILGLREEAGRPAMSMLSDYLRAKTTLLILDNCEHLIDACAKFADTILRVAPKIKILATSREALGIAGETAYRVPSLEIPNPKLQISIEQLTQYDAVRLFVDRALAVQPDFSVTNVNAPALAQICYRLDGIPLALELAAARVKSLSVEQIAARLDDRFRLLTGGSRTALPRQQTLRAAIDWSFSLLTKEERVLLCRLSVFAGGWTLEAAESVCGTRSVGVCEQLPHSDTPILDLLAHLVDKSLVIFEQRDSETRYRLMETIRQYAREKLLDSGEGEQARAAHFDFFLRLANDAAPQLARANQLIWLGRLEIEHDNLRAALDWALAQNEGERTLQLAIALNLFWLRRDHLKEGCEQIERVLAQTEALSNAPLRVRVMALSVLFALYQSDYARVRTFARTYLGYARAIGDTYSEGKLLWGLGWLAWHESDYAGAQALLEECLTRFTASRDLLGCADALHFLGHVAVDQSRYDAAQRYFAQSSALYKELDDHIGLLPLIGDLGLIAYLQDDFDHARAFCEQQLALGQSLDSKDNQMTALNRLGDLARCAGDDATAEKYYTASLEILRPMGVTLMLGNLQHNLAHIAKNRGEYARAVALFQASLALYREQNDKKGIGEYLVGIAGIAAAMGNLERAARLFGAAQVSREAMGATLWPANRIAYERDLATLCAQLDEATFNAAWAEGQKLTLEQAIDLAMKEVGNESSSHLSI